MKYLILPAIILLFIFSVSAAPLDDKAITRNVTELLVKEHDIPNTNIQIKVVDKIIYLSGDVDTGLQANRIIELASSVKSVVDVNADKLNVRNSKEFLSDAFITAKTKGKIKYLALNNRIAEHYILHVETTNKIVHIFGDVKNKQDIKTIKDSIEDIIDVAGVKMNIKCP
mgnify:CR=1 FL=1